MSSNIRLSKTCQFCNSEFIAKTTVTKFCSDTCAKKAYKVRVRTKKISDAVANAQEFRNSESLSQKDFLNINEAGELLNSSRWTIHRLVKSGKLKATKIGSRTIISRKSIDKLFQS